MASYGARPRPRTRTRAATTTTSGPAWEQQPGRIHAGQRSGRATDWWDLETAAADFDRAAELGLNSLRLSVEWSRIEPEQGVFDRTALRKYAEMIGLLRARGLAPMVTLHHFTDPLWLADLGGWENPLAVDTFARFTGRVVEALGDQVTLWCTINEPTVYAYIGYNHGHFPPGVHSLPRTLDVLRRMLLAHARAYRTIHRLQNNACVGLAHHIRVYLPRDPARAADRRAAAVMDRLGNRSVYDAITDGRLTLPLGVGQRVTPLIDTCDYIGVNYYTPVRVAFDPRQPGQLFMRESFAAGRRVERPHPQKARRTARSIRVAFTWLCSRRRPTASRSTSPKTACPTTTTTCGRASSRPTWPRPGGPSGMAPTCAATTTGRWWITSSGRQPGACASACSSSTRRPVCGRPAPARPSTPDRAGQRRAAQPAGPSGADGRR